MKVYRCESVDPHSQTRCAREAVATANHPGGPPWHICQVHIDGLRLHTPVMLRPLPDDAYADSPETPR